MYLSYLMGAGEIGDGELVALGIKIVETKKGGERALEIPTEGIRDYEDLIRRKMSPGYWNEYVGAERIIFIFKHKDKRLEEYELSTENEAEIDTLAAHFNDQEIPTKHNVYRWLANNTFYHDFMLLHYRDQIER